MGIMGLFKKKVKPILKQEDLDQLRELERQAYMEEARKLIVEKAKADAKNQIKIKSDPY